ncbi:hypothetical protein TR67_05395 [Pseudomonas deceptionensis]|nr:hypothetical protein TR67_05395 [Pseudomonas deceptionensis]
MALYIHAIIHDAYAFSAQTRPLFVTGRAACWQADAPASCEYPVPGQARAFGELAERSPNPACRPTQPGQFGKLAVRHHITGGHHHQG